MANKEIKEKILKFQKEYRLNITANVSIDEEMVSILFNEVYGIKDGVLHVVIGNGKTVMEALTDYYYQIIKYKLLKVNGINYYRHMLIK